MQYGELYHKNYYREVKDKNRVYYEFYHLDGTENVPEDYKEISFVLSLIHILWINAGYTSLPIRFAITHNSLDYSSR